MCHESHDVGQQDVAPQYGGYLFNDANGVTDIFALVAFLMGPFTPYWDGITEEPAAVVHVNRPTVPVRRPSAFATLHAYRRRLHSRRTTALVTAVPTEVES